MDPPGARAAPRTIVADGHRDHGAALAGAPPRRGRQQDDPYLAAASLGRRRDGILPRKRLAAFALVAGLLVAGAGAAGLATGRHPDAARQETAVTHSGSGRADRRHCSLAGREGAPAHRADHSRCRRAYQPDPPRTDRGRHAAGAVIDSSRWLVHRQSAARCHRASGDRRAYRLPNRSRRSSSACRNCGPAIRCTCGGRTERSRSSALRPSGRMPRTVSPHWPCTVRLPTLSCASLPAAVRSTLGSGPTSATRLSTRHRSISSRLGRRGTAAWSADRRRRSRHAGSSRRWQPRCGRALGPDA